MTQEELARLHDEARAEMKKIPGVVGVGYGFKRTGGKLTDQVGFTVYVKEKKDKSAVKPEEIIPADYKGIPTDVDTVPQITDYDCEDHTTHSPLIGGITISTLIQDSTQTPPSIGVGTLGFFATINGVNGPNNVALVSNAHVLTAGGATAGATIYQPPLVQQNGGWALNSDPKADNNPIGHVANAGLEGNYPYTYPGETQNNYYIDCATAKLNICISSWCHTNCGVSFTDQVINLAIPPGSSNVIVDIARVQQIDIGTPDNPKTYVVYKVGQRTGRTQGKITAVNNVVAHTDPSKPSGNNGIEITPTQPDCDNILQFANEGDSGSALINSEGKLVGIICGGDTTKNPPTTLACHIHPVLDFLKVTPITQANPATGNRAFSAPPAAAQPAQSAPAQPSAAPALRQRLAQSEEGAQLIALVERHANEVVHLVNNQRRVTVTWHRNQGPQFLNEAILNAHDASHAIPLEIGGVTRETLLRRMAKVLTDYGTAGLRASVELHFEKILRRIQAAPGLHDMIDRFFEVREPGEGRAF